MVNATYFLTVLLQTHEWAQYAYQQVACMRSVSLMTDCNQVFRGQGIADINVNPNYAYCTYNTCGGGWDYLYSYMAFAGWQQDNFTALNSFWFNATKTVMLTSCAANSTCYNVYNDYPAADTTLDTYIHTAIQNFSGALPPSGSNLNWITEAELGYANALSAWTTLVAMNEEVFGIDHSLNYAAMNSTDVVPGSFQIGSALTIYLSGGAEMVETVLNFIAFRFYNFRGTPYDASGLLEGYVPALPSSTTSTTAGTLTKTLVPTSSISGSVTSPSLRASSTSSRKTTSSSKATSDVSIHGSSSSSSTAKTSSVNVNSASRAKASSSVAVMTEADLFNDGVPEEFELYPAKSREMIESFVPNRKFADLQHMAKLRGPARKKVSSLRYANYLDLGQDLPLSPSDDWSSIAKRDCQYSDTITTIQSSLSPISIGCRKQTISNAYMSLNQLAQMPGLEATVSALRSSNMTRLDTVSSIVAAISPLCNLPGIACYPAKNMWFSGNFSDISTAVGKTIRLASESVTAGLSLNVACLVCDLAIQAFDNAARCCARNCALPACMAANIGAGFIGAGALRC